MAFLMDSPFEASFPVSTTAVVEGTPVIFAVTSGVLTVAPSTATTSVCIGVACQDGAVGDLVRVRLFNAPLKGKVAGAYAALSFVFAGASGLLTSTANTAAVQKFQLMEVATTAANQVCTMIPVPATSAGA